MIGRQLTHYRVIQKLGSGGMGQVYRARDEHLARDVALKVLPANTFHDEGARRRFRREATALSRLNHPNIATVHDFDREGDVDFLVMEYVDGTTLRQKLEDEGPLPVDEVVSLGIQIAEALEEAHDRGVVHRDLKPANVALTRRGHVKVLDFGLARVRGPVDETAATESLTKGVVGTLPYMAPENLLGAPPHQRGDIYALGVVLYELATGRRPFAHKMSTALADDILHRPPDSPRVLRADLPQALEQTILRCLEKSPERRFASARELIRALREGATSPGPDSILKRSAPLRGRRAAIAALLLTAVGAGTAVFFGLSSRRGGVPRPAAGKIMLAVLPFDNLSPDPEQEYFSAGLTDELIAQLGRLSPQRLGVIARTSATLYRNRGMPVSAIGRELGVEYLLEGSVRSDGHRVRITAQLVQATDQTQLWASSYERSLTRIFDIQSDVARRVATSLAIELLPAGEALLDRTPTENIAAHEAYLRGRYHLRQRTAEGLREALSHFEQAVALDPAYARAYSGLADTHMLLAGYGLVPRAEGHEQSARFARQALQLDDTLAEAHTSLAAALAAHQGDIAAAEREFRRAIELNPSYALAHQWLSALLSGKGRHAEAVLEAEIAWDLDPLNPRIAVDLARALYFARRYDQALTQSRRALGLDPDFAPAHSMLGLVSLELGRYQEAIAEIDAGAPKDSPSLWRGHALARAGRRAEARRELEAWEARWEEERAAAAPAAIAAILAALGEKEEALDWLEKTHESSLRELYSPHFDTLRSDRRFQALLEQRSRAEGPG
jgi:TolB-like protein/Flp pilus assembly protein TadD/predicted Ser/Thr protein kinase